MTGFIIISALAILFVWEFKVRPYLALKLGMAALAAHERCQLAIDRIRYIGELRSALRTCNDFIDATRSLTARQLKEKIHELTTAVDTNGQPLKKHELH